MFLGTSAAAGLLAAGGSTLSVAAVLRENGYIERMLAGRLIANRKTGVVHHTLLCAGHLPAEANRDPDIAKYLKPGSQSSRLFNVYEVLAYRQLAKGDDKGAVGFFREAIRLRPTQCALYGRLSRVFGKLKRYDEIVQMYTWGVRQADAALRAQPTSHKLLNTRRFLLDQLARSKRRAADRAKKEDAQP